MSAVPDAPGMMASPGSMVPRFEASGIPSLQFAASNQLPEPEFIQKLNCAWAASGSTMARKARKRAVVFIFCISSVGTIRVGTTPGESSENPPPRRGSRDAYQKSENLTIPRLGYLMPDGSGPISSGRDRSSMSMSFTGLPRVCCIHCSNTNCEGESKRTGRRSHPIRPRGEFDGPLRGAVHRKGSKLLRKARARQ